MSLRSLLTGFRNRAAMQAEINALRQLIVLQRTQKTKRLILGPSDRCLWRWRSVLIIVKLKPIIGWHREGFRWYWTWKIRHGRSGRPLVSKCHGSSDCRVDRAAIAFHGDQFSVPRANSVSGDNRVFGCLRHRPSAVFALSYFLSSN